MVIFAKSLKKNSMYKKSQTMYAIFGNVTLLNSLNSQNVAKILFLYTLNDTALFYTLYQKIQPLILIDIYNTVGLLNYEFV